MIIRKVAVFFSCVFLFSSLAFASSLSRPKIGLVLGGGGARGTAHIGVLKILKQLRIPIDYIAGTSMGAVVGGLYACGMTVEEIEEVFNSVDWQDIFSDRPTLENITFRRKQDNRKYINDLELGFKNGKFVFPRGLIAGQKLGFLLKSLTLHTYATNDFNSFAIPFRAIATNIETGDVVVLATGDLAKAISASMAVPGAFPPIEIDGQLLVDGGVVNNLPIDVVKKMGADIIIAVEVGVPLEKKDKLRSVLDISGQVINIMTQQSVREQIKTLNQEDIFICPDLKDIMVTDFGRYQEGIVAGEVSTKSLAGRLARYSVSEDAYANFANRRKERKDHSEVIDFIKIKETSLVSQKIIKKKMHVKEGQALNLKMLEEDLSRIYEMGDFQQVDFKFVEENGKKGVVIIPTEKSWGPNYFRFGENLSNDFEGGSYYNFLLGFTKTRINPLGAEWKNEFQVGRKNKIFSELYQPLDYSESFFAAPHVEWIRNFSDVYNQTDRIAEYRVTALLGGVDVGVQFSKYAELRLGIDTGKLTAGPIIGDSTSLPDFDINLGGISTHFIFDQFDKPYFPRKGIRVEAHSFISQPVLGADESYEKLGFLVNKVFTHKKHTLVAGLHLGTKLGNSDIPYYDYFTLGGFLNLSGYRQDQIRGQYFLLNKLFYYYQLAKLPSILGDAVYVGGSIEYGNAWENYEDVSKENMRLGGSFVIGADTVIGPLYLAYGYCEEEDGKIYLYLGQSF